MRSRYLFLVIIFGLATLVWSAYLFALQIFDPFKLDRFRQLRYIPDKEILIPTRGSIYDANGDLLVSSISYYQIDIDRRAVSLWAKKQKMDLQEAYARISKVLSNCSALSAGDVLKRLNINDKLNSIQISNKIREMELDRIISTFDKEKIPGLNYSFSSMRRIYSKGILAARLLGSVQPVSDGYDPETQSKSLYKLNGICGIEASFNDLLAGEYGWREVVYDANHERVPYPNLHEKQSQDGFNLKLTIDSKIQEIVEHALYEGAVKYSAKNVGAIAMDPNTGRILALAGVSPEDRSIDPGLVRVKSNIPLSFMFEPGSTMKPLTMLPALEHKLVRPNEKIACGVYQVGKRTIRDTHHYGALTPKEIIAKSSNVGVAKIAERIGKKRLYEKFISLGYGQKTGLGLYGESSGLFRKPDDWDGYTLHSLSFGQAISVTALQHMTAFSAVANGGKMMKPYIVDSITNKTGQVIQQFEPEVLREIASKAVTDTIRSYMKAVIDDGTGKHIKMDYITIAGKTGTAQKNVEGTRGYSSGKYTSVFVGMFPAEEPKMVLLVFYDEPAPGYHYGSTSAAPTFKKIVEDILFMPNYNIIGFDERMTQRSLQMPDLHGKHISQAEAILNKYGFLYKIEGVDSSSVVIDQFPKANVSVDPHHPITIKVGSGLNKADSLTVKGTMPNLTGLTIRRAMQVAAKHKVPLKIKGSGIVRQQSILPGSLITGTAACTIEASI